MAKLKNNNTEKYLRHFAENIIRKAKQILKAKKKDVTGALSGSLKYRLHAQEGGGYKIFFKSADYGKFVDKGVSGTKVRRMYTHITGQKRKSPFSYKPYPSGKGANIGALEKWISRKGIKGRDKKTGKFMKTKSLAYLFSKSIQRKGLKGTNFLSKPLSDAFTSGTTDNFAVKMSEAFRKDIVTHFENLEI